MLLKVNNPETSTSPTFDFSPPKKLLQENLHHLNDYDYKNKISLNLFACRQIKLCALIMIIRSSQVRGHIYPFCNLLLTSVLFSFQIVLSYVMFSFTNCLKSWLHIVQLPKCKALIQEFPQGGCCCWT